MEMFVQQAPRELVIRTPLLDTQMVRILEGSDISYVSGHGTYRFRSNPEFVGSIFGDNSGEYYNLRPKDVGFWTGDAEWLVFFSCSIGIIDLPVSDGELVNDMPAIRARVLDGVPEFGKLWMGTMKSALARGSLHGILAYRGGSRGRPIDSNIAKVFVGNLKAGMTIVDAWLYANLSHPEPSLEVHDDGTSHYSGLNAVAIYHEENANDKMGDMSPDTNGSTFVYKYIHWKYDATAQNKVKYIPDVGNAIKTKTLQY